MAWCEATGAMATGGPVLIGYLASTSTVLLGKAFWSALLLRSGNSSLRSRSPGRAIDLPTGRNQSSTLAHCRHTTSTAGARGRLPCLHTEAVSMMDTSSSRLGQLRQCEGHAVLVIQVPDHNDGYLASSAAFLASGIVPYARATTRPSVCPTMESMTSSAIPAPRAKVLNV